MCLAFPVVYNILLLTGGDLAPPVKRGMLYTQWYTTSLPHQSKEGCCIPSGIQCPSFDWWGPCPTSQKKDGLKYQA